jgi:hypothetical protein
LLPSDKAREKNISIKLKKGVKIANTKITGI